MVELKNPAMGPGQIYFLSKVHQIIQDLPYLQYKDNRRKVNAWGRPCLSRVRDSWPSLQNTWQEQWNNG